MAKIKFGMMMTDGRGKLGGQVFSRNRGGAYVRTKVTPLNPQTSFQQAARSLLTQFAQAWRGLTEAQRTAWNNAVSNFATTDVFGDLKEPTGLQLYIRLNVNISNGGGSTISVPPVPTGADALSSLSFTYDTALGQVVVTFAPDPVPADHAMYIEGTAALSPGINNASAEFRHVQTLAAATASGADIVTAYENKFGAGIAGQKYFIRAKLINITTGEVSQTLVASAIAS